MVNPSPDILGCPIHLAQGTLRVGEQLQGVHLIRDINLLETISHITHERIPERVVHAKGAGAYGTFEVTNAGFITQYTDASFLNADGKTTPLFARFSTVVGERGSADSVRDTRGFAFKLYTEHGNLDWVFFSTPTFQIRDGAKFPSFAHAQKRDPQTGVRNPSTGYALQLELTIHDSFMSRNPETFHTLMFIFSDSGTPQNYRHSDIHSGTSTDDYVYVRIQMRTNQKIANLSQKEAEQLAGTDPDAYTRDLYNSIYTGDFPSWDVYAQIVKPGDVATFPVNIFDPTKTWPENKAAWTKFGKITLNRNPIDYFEEVEQVSFNPAAVVPGWDVSPDPILQTRLFAYGSAARYRLGINLHQLPVNAVQSAVGAYNPTKRDGAGYINQLNPRVQPNYFPAGGAPLRPAAADVLAADQDTWSGKVTAYESTVVADDWTQPRQVWDSFDADQKTAFVNNVALSLGGVEQVALERTYGCFREISSDLEQRIRNAVGGGGDNALTGPREPAVGPAVRNRGGVGG
ncbi:catA, catalase [Chaetomium sp. MPI-CAGE-AT-0009]|nr:catA, catalase [Chaetomium sp. MPI-CAGE-AT-0009]